MKGAELARRSGLPKQSVYRGLRREQAWSVDQIWAIAGGLGVPPAALLPDVGTAEPTSDPDGLSPPLTAAERLLIEQARAGDRAAALAALAAVLALPVDQLAPEPRPNPSGPALDSVGRRAAQLADAIARTVPGRDPRQTLEEWSGS